MLVDKKLSRLLIIFGVVALLTNCATNQNIESQFDAVSYVDPQIGSVHGRWFFYTPAALPFGMAKLAPHTNAYNGPGSWLPQGYDNRHTSIEGFGHFHEFQIGGLVVMPTTGKLKTVPGTLEKPDDGYRSRFDKETELAEPGYYSVQLKDYQIKAELTATERVGFHRYTFPESTRSNLIIDVGHMQGESKTVTDAFVRMTDNYEVEGYIETLPEYLTFCDPDNRVTMYFVIKTDKKPESFGTFVNEQISEGAKESNAIENGMYLSFSTSANEQIEMQVGLSYTSIENARINLKTESTDQTFASVKETANIKWNQKLGKIQVEGGEEKDRVKFYTALYHALLGRGLASDVNGQYIQHDNTIAQIPLDENGKPKYNHHNTDGIWGAFWNLGQVWSLAYPDFMSNYVQTNIDFYKNSGWLHDGMAAGAYTNGVQTNFQALFMASAYNCGIRDFDLKTGYEAALKNELEYEGRNSGNGKYDLSYFVKDGYIPSIDFKISNGWTFNFGCSHTLEFAFSSYAVAQMAQSLGHNNDSDILMKQAGYWKNIFDTETKFIRPKLENGNFMKDFDPMKGWKGFQEGNGYQYTWYVPHDQAGLIDAIGKDLFNERLEKTFTESQKSTFGGGKEVDSFSGVEKLYNHGNQPCLHQSWLFNYSGKPWLTQKWTRTICNEFYGTTPLHGYGYGQDEDQGQLGAWYVMASIGLFDVQGHAAANPTFQFGSPIFDKITIKLDNNYYSGKELVIETNNNSKENIYLQSAFFNDEVIENCWINRSLLTNGGILRFEMGNEPNKEWGIEIAPPSMSTK